MTESDTPADAAKSDASTTKAPPAWLISASMFVLAVVTIVVVVSGQ